MTTLDSLVTTADLNDAEERTMLADELEAAGRDVEAALLRGDGGVATREGRLVRVFRGVFTGLPTWFRRRCVEASHGGRDGYAQVGRQLAGKLGGMTPHDLEPDAWQAELDWLDEILQGNDPDFTLQIDDPWVAVMLGWFDFHFPRCMELIASGRRQRFASGILAAYEEGEIDLDAG